ncbi:MAG: LysR family transcriptional regulator [Alphaproteobacteria bacterium]|nr:LysR family transcriptional regulator [Alphaproteobacteria bacterium]
MHSIQQLELIAALARHRHFGRAAQELGISQPALTKNLAGIERRLGVKLFDRTPVAPTLFGDIVLARADAVRNGFEEILRELRLAKGLDTGELRVSAGVYAAEISVYEAMGRLSRRHPALACALAVKSMTDVMSDVQNGACDIGFAQFPEDGVPSEIETELLRTSPLLVYARSGHPLTRQASVSFAEVFDYPWVGPGEIGMVLPPGIDHPRGPTPPDRVVKTRIRAETISAIKAIVHNSDALSAAPRVLIGTDAAEGRLTILPLELPWLRMYTGFIWRRGRTLSPAARVFMSLVRDIEEARGP